MWAPVSVQIQLRDLPGFAEARHQLLQLRPGNRANWINFAVAHHLNGNHELAVQVHLTADVESLIWSHVSFARHWGARGMQRWGGPHGLPAWLSRLYSAHTSAALRGVRT